MAKVLRSSVRRCGGGTLALLGCYLSARFFDGIPQLVERPVDLVFGDDRGRCDQQMVAGDAVYTSLNGIDQQAALQGGSGHAPREIQFRSERPFAVLVGNELHAAQQPDAADFAYGLKIEQRRECVLQLGGGSSFASGVGSLYEFLLLQAAQHGAPRCQGDGMSV